MAPEVEPVDAKQLSREQFGANAANYATSEVHAKGASLARLVELVQPEPTWTGLDIATAAGHTALVFAAHLRSVTATDLTAAMVALARRRAEEADVANLSVAQADAENLPFVGSSFDLVTCRIAPHHFPDPTAFLEGAARVLRPGGVFAMVDNIVPDHPDAARWYNDWERRRDPSHVRCLSAEEWLALIAGAGMAVRTVERATKPMRFQSWVDNMSVPATMRTELLNDLVTAPAEVRAFLSPTGHAQSDATFELTELLVIAERH